MHKETLESLQQKYYKCHKALSDIFRNTNEDVTRATAKQAIAIPDHSVEIRFGEDFYYFGLSNRDIAGAPKEVRDACTDELIDVLCKVIEKHVPKTQRELDAEVRLAEIRAVKAAKVPNHKLPPLERVLKEFTESRHISSVQFGENDITDNEIAKLRKNGHLVILRENYIGDHARTLLHPSTQCVYVKEYGPVQDGVDRIVTVWRLGHSGPGKIVKRRKE